MADVLEGGPAGLYMCAVVVLYGQPFSEAHCWPALQLSVTQPPMRAGAALKRVLVYDNSPSPSPTSTGDGDPPWMDYVHDPANGGTGAAYRRAAEWAAAQGASWLLLLDQDTTLPPDFIGIALETIDALDPMPTGDGTPVALVPVVIHGEQVISPACIGHLGQVIPLPACQAKAALPACSTAIASGAVLHVPSLQEVMPLPNGLWLDYVDHWLFRELRRHGTVAGIGATLIHDLSVATPRQMSDFRLRSIVCGEAIFMQKESLLARAVFRLRLVKRALSRSALSPRQRYFLFAFAMGMQTDAWSRIGTDQRSPSS